MAAVPQRRARRRARPERTIQIGIRGAAEYLWEFSYESGMTVIHAEEVSGMGIPAIIEKARAIDR
jgi:guanidinopropionase